MSCVALRLEYGTQSMRYPGSIRFDGIIFKMSNLIEDNLLLFVKHMVYMIQCLFQIVTSIFRSTIACYNFKVKKIIFIILVIFILVWYFNIALRQTSLDLNWLYILTIWWYLSRMLHWQQCLPFLSTVSIAFGTCWMH